MDTLTPQSMHTEQCQSFAFDVLCLCDTPDIDSVESFYDIDLKSASGEADFLKEFDGKVTLVINTTGECGNAPQFGVIEDLYQEYKNEGFEVLAIPTNDYCGANLTYGEHVYGCEDAKGSEKFGKEKYNVTYKFAELVASNPGPGDLIPGLPSRYGTIDPHFAYKWLSFNAHKQDHTKHGSFMHGNFEKYLVGKDGKLIAYFRNGDLLDQNSHAKEIGITGAGSDRAHVTGAKIREAIEKALAS